MLLKNCLEKEQARYEKIKKELSKKPRIEVEGSLVINKNNTVTQYFINYFDKDEGKYKRRYLTKDKMKFIENLAQANYEEKMLKLVNRRLKQISKLNKEYDDEELEKLYSKLSLERKKLVKPVEESFEAKVMKWKRKPYVGKGFDMGDIEIYTKKGERVRSKSEKILADRFYDLGIEYKYECPLQFRNGLRFFPDFTFLSPYTGEEIYWEHYGMIDNEKYSLAAVKKLIEYEKNGIFRGDRLIVSYELSSFNLDYTWVDKLIYRYLKKLDS
ncbi:MAG: hypothetical protein Q4E50_05500 [Tissierellia bacterium]|nr:hypothetical protein [Tissierellia bacterium]